MQPDEIRTLRLKLNLTQLAFGRLLGIEEATKDESVVRTVARWEAGDSRPERYYAEGLAELAAEVEAAE